MQLENTSVVHITFLLSEYRYFIFGCIWTYIGKAGLHFDKTEYLNVNVIIVTAMFPHYYYVNISDN